MDEIRRYKPADVRVPSDDESGVGSIKRMVKTEEEYVILPGVLDKKERQVYRQEQMNAGRYIPERRMNEQRRVKVMHIEDADVVRYDGRHSSDRLYNTYPCENHLLHFRGARKVATELQNIATQEERGRAKMPQPLRLQPELRVDMIDITKSVKYRRSYRFEHFVYYGVLKQHGGHGKKKARELFVDAEGKYDA